MSVRRTRHAQTPKVKSVSRPTIDTIGFHMPSNGPLQMQSVILSSSIAKTRAIMRTSTMIGSIGSRRRRSIGRIRLLCGSHGCGVEGATAAAGMRSDNSWASLAMHVGADAHGTMGDDDGEQRGVARHILNSSV